MASTVAAARYSSAPGGERVSASRRARYGNSWGSGAFLPTSATSVASASTGGTGCRPNACGQRFIVILLLITYNLYREIVLDAILTVEKFGEVKSFKMNLFPFVRTVYGIWLRNKTVKYTQSFYSNLILLIIYERKKINHY